MVIDDWQKLRQLEAFRLVLMEGFAIHLSQNAIIQSKFEFENIAAKSMNSRQFDTSVSKSRAKERKSLRRDKFA